MGDVSVTLLIVVTRYLTGSSLREEGFISAGFEYYSERGSMRLLAHILASQEAELVTGLRACP